MTRDPKALRIVAIGGGTGLSTLLHGLKAYTSLGAAEEGQDRIDITAIVTVTDDGGSSGRLRRELDILPPGDIRNCLVALSEDEALLSRLFQFRFANGNELKGHNFGNLFLTALTYITGDFAQAVKLSSEILAVRGRIYPSTSCNVTLEARLEDGTKLVGESNIGKSPSRIKQVHIRPRHCDPMPEAVEELAQADLICMGPGSLFTSVIPNLLVAGIPEVIARSPALKVYVSNIMWQPGETMGFTAADHVRAIHQHAQRKLLDCVLVNTSRIATPLRLRYEEKQAQPVINDFDALEELGVDAIGADLLARGDKIRHDSAALARSIVNLAAYARHRKQNPRLAMTRLRALAMTAASHGTS